METNVHYRKIWENFHNIKIPPNHDIHHIDGNRNNNSIENLMLVSLKEHLEIHKNQGDWGAVHAIQIRMNNSDVVKNAASLHQKTLLKEGRHNFQKDKTKNNRKKQCNKMMKARIDSGLGAFIIQDRTENSRKAGKAAADKKAGFLDTKSKNHGSNFVKNTKWWTHKSGKRKRSCDCPGIDWRRGMKYDR